MKLHKLLITSVLLLIYITSSAQVTNVRKWRKTEKDSLENGLFLYDEKSYLQALPIFDNIYAHHPGEEFIKYVYAKCGLYRSDKHEDSYALLSEIYAKNKRVEDIQYDLALAAHYNNKFDEALEYVNAYLQTRHLPFENKKAAEMLKQYIGNGKYYTANPTMAKVTDLSSAINSADDEYAPAIKADESAMIFTYVGPKSIGGLQNNYLQPDPNGNYMEDVYMSYKLNGEFTTAFPIDSLNTNAPDAAVSLSNDGSILFIYKNENDNHGDIYQSELVGEHYSKPRKVQGQVNSYSWDGHCSLSPDGRTMYFSSERGGGNGGRDIYRASLSEDGSWQHAVNLGDSVNTPYDEDAPFIHPDGVTLYYSSNGKKSMGGYDVLKATMNPNDSTFRKVENLGYPINSTDDDIYFVTAANSEKAYYSSGRKGGKGLKDIYQIETNFKGAKPSLYLVKGEVQYDGEDVAASIKVDVLSRNKVFGTFTSNANTGAYLISLPAGETYKITYSYKELPSKTLDVDLMGISGYSEKTYNVDFKDKPQIPVVVAPPVKIPSTPLAKTELIKENKAKQEAAKAEAAKAKEEIVMNGRESAVSNSQATVSSPSPATKSTSLAAVKPSTVSATAPTASTSVKPVATNTLSNRTSTVTTQQTLVKEVPKTTAPAVRTLTITPPTPEVEETFARAKDGFIPRTRLHEKAIKYIEKYGDIALPGLEFRVQISAFKTDRNQAFPHLRKYGKIERVQLGDGFTRLYIGGTFKTLRTAFALTKRVVMAGQTDSFVSAFYNGERLTYEDLERVGVFK